MDNVNHPAHYMHNSFGIETIEITAPLDFCLGNAVKYISRSNHKGKKTEDLQKAQWYLNYTIEHAEDDSDLEIRDLNQTELLFIQGLNVSGNLKMALTIILISDLELSVSTQFLKRAVHLIDLELSETDD